MADVSPLGFDGHAVSSITPDLQALLDLMQQGAPAEADGLTTREWMTRLGMGEERVRRMIKRLMAAGLMTHGTAQRRNMVGNLHPEHVYQLVSK